MLGPPGDTKLSAFRNNCFSKPPHFGNRGAAPEINRHFFQKKKASLVPKSFCYSLQIPVIANLLVSCCKNRYLLGTEIAYYNNHLSILARA